MDIKSEIEKIKWHSNLLNAIVEKYEDNPHFFMDEEKKESVILMSTILNKINEDYSVSINMIKNNLLNQQSYTMDIDNSDNSDSDTNSNMSNCSVGSDNFLYGLDNSDDDSNEFNKLSLNNNTDDEIEELYGSYDEEDNENEKTIKKIDYPEAICDNITVQNTVKMEETKKESVNNNFKENLLNETIDFEKILLYKKNNKNSRLSNYLENSYSY